MFTSDGDGPALSGHMVFMGTEILKQGDITGEKVEPILDER